MTTTSRHGAPWWSSKSDRPMGWAYSRGYLIGLVAEGCCVGACARLAPGSRAGRHPGAAEDRAGSMAVARAELQANSRSIRRRSIRPA